MAQQVINNGAAPGDGTGESAYDAFQKAIDNFDELYDTRGATGTITASEALTGGHLVNIHTVTGNARIRKANATDTTKPAHAFVKVNVGNGNPGVIFGPGQIVPGLAGLTPGATYYLDTTGGQITAAPPATTLNGVQEVGQALSATELMFSPRTMVEAP